ncbi:MAG: AAA family ATPase [Candidatus Saccharibacteria bacterium]
MSKLSPSRPLLIMVYGYPGSGKSFFGRELSNHMQAAHIQSERIRSELFEKPNYSKQENQFVTQFMDYMSEEFLKAGVSVIYDANANTQTKRRAINQLAKKTNSVSLLVWLQIDIDSAYFRASNRDHRKIDDKYSKTVNKKSFEDIIKKMENPSRNEDYIVISGKHTFKTQQSAIVKKLHDLGLLYSDDVTANSIKPQLVNLVPNSIRGRVDMTRRNINIR